MNAVGRWHAWKILSNQIKPGLPSLASGCQVNIKCFYAMRSTCLGSNYRNISSLTLGLVQKVIPGYLIADDCG
jgi:hypothetical protein